MITAADFYEVISAMVPLYIAMLLGYASVRWWSIFSAVQCSGINRFVAIFAIPVLSFTFISRNDPYKMDGRFILADSASKLVVLVGLGIWVKLRRSSSGSDDKNNNSFDWSITLFSVSTLPNTLVMGIPLLQAMYGELYGELMVQVVVLQSIIWYTLLLFMFEFRAARRVLMEQQREVTEFYVTDFYVPCSPGRRSASVMNMDLYGGVAGAGAGAGAGLIVSPRRSSGVAANYYNMQDIGKTGGRYSTNSPRRSSVTSLGTPITMVVPGPGLGPGQLELLDLGIGTSNSTLGFTSTFTEPAARMSSASSSSAAYILRSASAGFHNSSSNFDDNTNLSCVDRKAAGEAAHPNVANPIAGQISSSLDASNVFDKHKKSNVFVQQAAVPCHYSAYSPKNKYEGNVVAGVDSCCNATSSSGALFSRRRDMDLPLDVDAHLYLDAPPNITIPSSSSESPSSSHFAQNTAAATNYMQYKIPASPTLAPINVREDFSFGSKKQQLVDSQETGTNHNMDVRSKNKMDGELHSIVGIESDLNRDNSPSKATQTMTNTGELQLHHDSADNNEHGDHKEPLKPMLPSSTIMLKLILKMVFHKLIRNPNTYASLIGVAWSLIAFRYGITMPKIISESLKILSQAGLGMAMFSLGLFMALQPKIIACGTSLAIFAMVIRFLIGPTIMGTTSVVVGLRGIHLRAAIVQAALPQGIVPFVFSREYDLHPDILSTAVIFGMLVALPTTLLYYILLGI